MDRGTRIQKRTNAKTTERPRTVSGLDPALNTLVPGTREKIEVHRLPGGPNGFPYAVLHGAQVTAWMRSMDEAHQFAYWLSLLEVIEGRIKESILTGTLNLLRNEKEERGALYR